ncbi:MAG: ferritin family protein [Candidatus Omnitrophica bacterium]|nr:ferritin family protein [Candidatus Omnitrophota bacterium]
MDNLFLGSEIVELGIQIEKNGMDFYDVLSKKSPNKIAREVFKFLKGEEERHIQAFQKVLESAREYEPAESYQGEYIAYMRALAREHVFTQRDKGAQVARTVKTDTEAVDLGIGFEKESIVFYEGMKKVVPEYDIKIVEELMAQEQTHLQKLLGLKSQLV